MPFDFNPAYRDSLEHTYFKVSVMYQKYCKKFQQRLVELGWDTEGITYEFRPTCGRYRTGATDWHDQPSLESLPSRSDLVAGTVTAVLIEDKDP